MERGNKNNSVEIPGPYWMTPWFKIHERVLPELKWTKVK